MKALNEDINVIAPLRDWNMNRPDEIKYAKANNIEVPMGGKYSVDENMVWKRSIYCVVFINIYKSFCRVLIEIAVVIAYFFIIVYGILALYGLHHNVSFVQFQFYTAIYIFIHAVFKLVYMLHNRVIPQPIIDKI